jgi:hypothetical protein
MTGPDYAVSPTALNATAAGIEAVIDGLRALGPPGKVELGRGVAQLAPSAGDVGHPGLSSAFLLFCDRWEWGVRTGVRVGEDLAADLRATDAAYRHAEGADQNLLARIAFDLAGDPAGVGETWEDVATSTVPQRGVPDWDELGGQWADTADDLAARSWPGMIARALRGADPFAGQLDDLRPIVE